MLLRTLGEARLEGGASDLSGRRKDIALLAYLARKAPRPVPRAELADLLWEDRDEARARQSLRQALLELKRVVGDGLMAGTDQARLDPQAVGLDVREFETAIADGRLEQAVAWWEGDFLAGMEETGGESLRIWLEIERETLRRLLGFALDRLSAESGARGDSEAAIGWAERWSRFLPHDERGHLRLIEALRLAGRTSEAQVRHTAFTARLRSELEREPSAELEALGLRIDRELARDRNTHRPGSAALFTPDLVGRSAALAELTAGWNAACTGEHTVVLVEGETGIGKTRLIEEFVRQVEASGSAVVARISAVSFGPDGETLAEALLGRLAAAPGLGAASPATLAVIAARVPKLRQRFPGLPPVTGGTSLDPAAAEAISVVAEERPVLLFVDDVERADSAARACLATITRSTVGRVLTILAIGEDDGSVPLSPGSVAGTRPRRLKLPPLTPAEVEALVASMLVLPAAERHALALRLHDEGGGNPLYMIELAAALVDEGVLAVGDRGAWTLVHPERWPVPLSGGLRTMIKRRTGRLSEEARIVAEAVARLDPVAEEATARVATKLPDDRFNAGRDELIARRLLRAAPLPGGGYQFHHQLVRRAILEEAAGRGRESAVRPGPSAASSPLRRFATLTAGGIAVAALAVLAIRHLTALPQADATDRRQVLITPPEITSDSPAADSATGKSLYAALGRSLSARTPPTSLVHGTLARMRRTDTLAPSDPSTAREVASRAGVRLLLIPSVVRSDDRVTVAYRIENTATGETVRARQRESAGGRAAREIAALMGSVEGDVSALASQVPGLDPLPAVTTASLDALRAYASGERLINTGDAGKRMLLRAIAIDTAFASAQAALAYFFWFNYDQRAAQRHAAAALRALDGLPAAERLQARLDVANALEDWPTAIDCARALIELNPTAPNPWQTLGQLLYFDRQFAAAVEAYDSAMARIPGLAPVRLVINRATVVARVGRIEEAVAGYEAAFAKDPPLLRHPYVNHEYGAALVRLGRVGAARAAYAARLAGTPEERAAAFRSMALLEAHGGRFAQAGELLSDAITGSTATGDTLGAAIGHVLRADVTMTRGDTAAALHDLTAVERYAMSAPLPYEVLAHAVKQLARTHATPRAASLLTRLQTQTTAVSDAARARLLIARGEVLLARGDVREGRNAIEQALALDPTNEARESAAFAAAAAGDLPQAAQRYDFLAADRGIDWDGHVVIELGRYLAGRAWERAGRPDRARTRYEAFLADWSAEPSDSTLPAVIDARRRLSRLSGQG